MAMLLCFYFISTSFVIAFVKSDVLPTRPDQETLQQSESGNGIVGVASIAGITSRNGRVSSLGGIHFYPGPDEPLSISNTDGSGYYYPLTVTKEADGKYASGSIQLYPEYPGSNSVVVTARSGFGPEFKPQLMNYKPLRKEIFFQPLPEYFEKARNFEPIQPWFLKNIFPFAAPSHLEGENSWFYPNFNPFVNFWR